MIRRVVNHPVLFWFVTVLAVLFMVWAAQTLHG